MDITVELLRLKKFGKNRIKWFKEHFDDNVELQDVLAFLCKTKDTSDFGDFLHAQLKLNGEWRRWRKNGHTKHLYSYNDGKLDGLQKCWDEEGKPGTWVMYADGNLIHGNGCTMGAIYR
jgi:antitoxin component YwqK of YwqJK toxin-antitoxin module